MSQGFKMLSWGIGIALLASLKWEVHGQNTIVKPPTVQGSYRAMGEDIHQDVMLIQSAFEETYDAESKMAAISVRMFGFNTTFIEDYNAKITLQYVNDTACHVVSAEEWLEDEALPPLLGYQDKDGHIRFSLQQLLNIDTKFLKQNKENDTFRGMPARSWDYEIVDDKSSETVAVTAYWTVPTWKTTSSAGEIPLGYAIERINKGDKPGNFSFKPAQFISVFAFVHNAVDKMLLQPRSGVYCPNRTGIHSFPSMPKIDAVSLRSEFITQDYQTMKSFDVWYDMRHKLLRVNMDRITGQEPIYSKQGRKITSEVTSKFLESTFTVTIYEGTFTCEVIPLKDYQFEIQHLINPKLDKNSWSTNFFFGLDTTDYVYIGKTDKRNIPCNIFQGIRTDWPEKSANVTSLWEWCLATPLNKTDEEVNFRDGELPLINAQIYIMESKNKDFPVGFRIIHHFYDIMLEDPEVLSSSAYDVSRCFTEEQKKSLQFAVDLKIDDTNLTMVRDATSNPNFLYAWKNQIADNSGMRLDELRIANMKSTVYENVLYVMFTLLEVHPQLPKDITKSLTSLKNAHLNLTNAVDSGKIAIRFRLNPKAEMTVMKAKPKSLADQMDPATFVKQTTVTPGNISTELPPISTINFTLWTPPIRESNVTTPTTLTPTPPTTPTSGGKDDKIEGAGSGSVAAVTIIMLLVGVSLGSGGTYYKLRGLPSWLRK